MNAQIEETKTEIAHIESKIESTSEEKGGSLSKNLTC